MNIYIYVIAIIVICLMSFIFNHYHTEHMQNIYSLSRVGNGVGDTRGNKPMYDWGNIVPDNINFYDSKYCYSPYRFIVIIIAEARGPRIHKLNL